MKLLFEIGTEELPAGEIDTAVETLARHLIRACADARLSHGEVQTFATPRRLAVRIHDIAAVGEASEETALGPAVKAAFDAEGRPTKAAEGFAKGKGIAVEELLRVQTPKGEYIGAVVREEGKPAAEVLTAALQSVFTAFAWKRSMRWGWGTEQFARPIHTIIALLDGELLPVSFAGVEAGRETFGHRFLSSGTIRFDHAADDYAEKLRAAHVIASVDERKSAIRAGVDAALRSAGGIPIVDEGLIDEVVHLVEWPVPMIGTFDPTYTEIPREVLTTSMRTNQRYFAAETADGKLANLFCFVSNMIVRDPAVVVAGNGRVLVARLEDARFFFKEDRKRTLDSRRVDLERVLYMDRLGSVADRAKRIEVVAGHLATLLFSDEPAVATHATRAAQLCKADLVSGVVYQFPELQGTIGRAYAAADGEAAEVVEAIEAHYQPKGANDAPPASPVAICVSLADKLDTLVGCFALGLIPSGSADPYALRRSAIGILRTALDRNLRFDLRALIAVVAAGLPGELGARPNLVAEVTEFILDRLRNLLGQESPTDIVAAVVAVAENDLPSLRARAVALNAMRMNADFDPLAAAVRRVVNILKKADEEDLAAGRTLASEGEVSPAYFEKNCEGSLREAVCNTLPSLDSAVAALRFDEVANLLVGLKPGIDRFFDEVMVNAEDPLVRQNRLALLGLIRTAFMRFADISRIQTQGA